MVSTTIAPLTPEEKVVWYSLTWLYPIYLIGGLYLSGPVVGWLLFLIWIYRMRESVRQPATVSSVPLSSGQVVWVVGMMMMLLALIVGHINYDIGLVQIIKSSIGWMKGWALLALFILAGSLNVRFELITRACMIICVQSLLLVPFFVLSWAVGLPQTLYVSPLQAIGGPGPEFFAVSLYEIDPGSGLPRWRMFTPWAPALGLMANLFVILAMAEQSRFFRWSGYFAALLLILMSQSRLALVCLVFLVAYRIQLKLLTPVMLTFCLSILTFLLGFIAMEVFDSVEQLYQAFRSARQDSTRVREALARIAIERWQSEAPVWGHGVVERGPHLVEYMPIGSHHTWYGLLFIKGAVGLAALALPFMFSFFYTLVHQRQSALNRSAFLCLILLGLYTLGENLEMLAYLFWPALLVIGLAHSDKKRQKREAEER